MNNKFNLFLCFDKYKYINFNNVLNEIIGNKYNVIFFDFNNIDNDFFELNQMNLIIFVIDSNFFDNVELLNYARSAIKNNVPVLPVVSVEINDQKYKNIFGDFHYIKMNVDDIYTKDKKAISLYLETVLLDKESITKIKDSFRDYIFISYRKKDREYAKKFMNVIRYHRNLFSIALWFDDYLIPGENFNDEIKKQIEECGLFCLIVTPNLVVENNYVEKVEYPMARHLNKRIFSVEFIKTDKELLNEKYDGILDTLVDNIDSDIFKVIEDSIGTVINNISLEPIDYYYIGLAYLKGICTEKNTVVGIECLERAGDNGYYIAYKELANVYIYGIGKSFDIDKSFFYQSKYLNAKADEIIKKKNIDEVYSSYYEVLLRVSELDDKWKKCYFDYLKKLFGLLTENERECLYISLDIKMGKYDEDIQHKLNDIINKNEGTNEKINRVVELLKFFKLLFELDRQNKFDEERQLNNYYLFKKHYNDEYIELYKSLVIELMYDCCYNSIQFYYIPRTEKLVSEAGIILDDFTKFLNNITFDEREDYIKKVKFLQEKYQYVKNDPFEGLKNCKSYKECKIYVEEILAIISDEDDGSCLEKFYLIIEDLMENYESNSNIYSIAYNKYFEFEKAKYARKKNKKVYLVEIIKKQIKLLKNEVIDSSIFQKDLFVESINQSLGELYFQLAIVENDIKDLKNNSVDDLLKAIEYYTNYYTGYAQNLNEIMQCYLLIYQLTKDKKYKDIIKKIVDDLIVTDKISYISEPYKKRIKKFLHIRL